MSRAYRIKVSEALKRVLRAKDGVSTQLEVLEILPPEQMAELLVAELERRGYERDGEVLKKKLDGDIVVTIDPNTGVVSVHAEACAELDLAKTKEGRAWGEHNQKRSENALREELRGELSAEADREESKLQGELTEKLEAVLDGLRQELDQAVNKVTAEALKIKAAQIGQIKEITEDTESGSLTIVLEV